MKAIDVEKSMMNLGYERDEIDYMLSGYHYTDCNMSHVYLHNVVFRTDGLGHVIIPNRSQLNAVIRDFEKSARKWPGDFSVDYTRIHLEYENGEWFINAVESYNPAWLEEA